MRSILLAALFFLLGALVGSVPARRALSLAERERPAASRVGVGRDLAAFFGSAAASGTGRAPRSRVVEGAESTIPPSDGSEIDEPPVDPGLAEGVSADGTNPPPPGPTLQHEELDAARTALTLRRDQARAVLVEDADPSDEQLAEIDSAAERLNGRLRTLAEEVKPMIVAGQTPGRRQAMEYAADALDAMIVAEDEMRAALDADQLSGLDEGALDPSAWIDPSIVDLLESWDNAGE